MNKIDLPAAEPERVAQEVEDVIGLPCMEDVYKRQDKNNSIWSSLALIQILIYDSRKRSALECTAAQSFNGKRNRIF